MQDILTKLKEETPIIYNYLKKDLEYYINTNNKEKKFIYARLRLEKENIIALRKCIINNKPILNPEIIIEIKIYINKIKYKTILEQNYDSIDEIIKSSSTKNRLKSIGITKVRDLIDFSEEEIYNIEGLGTTSKKIIKNALKERNIILLDNPILVVEMLKEKNYGIIPNIICIDKKENIKKELELLYKTKRKLQEQINQNEQQIKKLEKKIGDIK